MSADGNKEPSPDGFTFKVGQMFWMDFRREILSLFDQFFETGDFDHQFYSSFTGLIPEVENPITINDFKPHFIVRLGA